jgi:glycosyltransferase involved in cell wall biosynthesis
LKDASIKLIEELGLQDNVIIKDFVENQELPELYNQSSVFILPSLAEGVPRTILEAMACGTPVVCTNLPQLIKIVSECGLLIPPGDPDAIARSLADLASDRKMAQAYGREGRMRAVSSYSWNDTVARTLELYSSLTKEYAGIISRKVEERSEHGET